jgi:hypothetical protein
VQQNYWRLELRCILAALLVGLRCDEGGSQATLGQASGVARVWTPGPARLQRRFIEAPCGARAGFSCSCSAWARYPELPGLQAAAAAVYITHRSAACHFDFFCLGPVGAYASSSLQASIRCGNACLFMPFLLRCMFRHAYLMPPFLAVCAVLRSVPSSSSAARWCRLRPLAARLFSPHALKAGRMPLRTATADESARPGCTQLHTSAGGQRARCARRPAGPGLLRPPSAAELCWPGWGRGR